MLTADLSQHWRRGQRIGPRYIEVKDSAYLKVAGDLIKILNSHLDHKRGQLDQALEEYVGVGTDYKILRGLIKLLLDQCEFETVSSIEPADIRRIVFLKAKEYHPINDENKQLVIALACEELGCSSKDITHGLYADLVENQRLVRMEELSAHELLDRYNLAQAQALLYRCVEMHIRIEPQDASSSRTLFEAIKSYRLIHTINGNANVGYDVRLDGPVSMFHRSQKYGVQMAVFLPALLLCKGWHMKAEINMKNSDRAYFELDSNQDRLRSHYLPAMTNDNLILDRIIAGWERVNTDWQLSPSKDVINVGEIAFIPDFVLYHEHSKKLYLEVLGFWTPRHLNSRLKEFERCGFKDFIILASEELCGSREIPQSSLPNVLIFKTSPDLNQLKSVLMKLTEI